MRYDAVRRDKDEKTKMTAKRQSTSIGQTAKTAPNNSSRRHQNCAGFRVLVVQERVNEVVTGEGSKAPRLQGSRYEVRELLSVLVMLCTPYTQTCWSVFLEWAVQCYHETLTTAKLTMLVP